MTLRTDPRQWLIYERGPVEATVRALETMALGIVGRTLAKHSSLPVRGIGNLMMRLAESRVRCSLGLVPGVETTDDRATATRWAIAVSNFALGDGPEPVQELDELHAAVVHLDSRLQSAGLTGPGWIRDLGRGD